MKRIKSPPSVLVFLMIVGCATLLVFVALVAAAATFHWLLMR
jgi:hypothetical protein